jgi:hypothetical protein
MNDLLQELMPEELESRLELQVLVDPMSRLSLATDNNNNNKPPIWNSSNQRTTLASLEVFDSL